jgi:hypothetical protein
VRKREDRLQQMDSLSAFLVTEIEIHWTRKASLEARALSLAGSNFAVITIFIGVWPYAGSVGIFRSSGGIALAAVAGIMALISIGSSAVAALPRRILGVDSNEARAMLASIEHDSVNAAEVKANILQLQQDEIESIQSTIQVAGILTLISAVAFVAMFLLLSGLFVASWSGSPEM